MKDPSTKELVDRLINTFKEMPQRRFLNGIQSSYDYTGIPSVWQYDAEVAIECLKLMAFHGDRDAFRSLRFLAHKITEMIDRMIDMAQADCSEKTNNLFKDVDWEERENDDEWESAASDDDLKQLAALPPDKLENIINTLDEACPAEHTLFLARFLTDSGRHPGLHSPPETETFGPLSPTEFDVLDKLTDTLAGIRARWEVVRMVRKELARAESWTFNLPYIEELRATELKRIDSLQIGSGCDLEPSLEKKVGRPCKITGTAMNQFAFRVYRDLDRERTREHYHGEIDLIRQSYDAYKNDTKLPDPQDSETRAEAETTLSAPESTTSHGSLKARAARLKEALARQGVEFITYGDNPFTWNPENEWKAAAALLTPLTQDPKAIEAWTDAGIKLLYEFTSGFGDISGLPEDLRREATGSNQEPSRKRVETTIRDALKDGFSKLATRMRQKRDE